MHTPHPSPTAHASHPTALPSSTFHSRTICARARALAQPLLAARARADGWAAGPHWHTHRRAQQVQCGRPPRAGHHQPVQVGVMAVMVMRGRVCGELWGLWSLWALWGLWGHAKEAGARAPQFRLGAPLSVIIHSYDMCAVLRPLLVGLTRRSLVCAPRLAPLPSPRRSCGPRAGARLSPCTEPTSPPPWRCCRWARGSVRPLAGCGPGMPYVRDEHANTQPGRRRWCVVCGG